LVKLKKIAYTKNLGIKISKNPGINMNLGKFSEMHIVIPCSRCGSNFFGGGSDPPGYALGLINQI